MTLSKLARLANVAVSTASKAFSMSDDINEQTREEIFRVARENGCFKKFFNAKYPKFVVALICPEVDSRHYSELCRYLQQRLQTRGCEICISSSEFSAQTAADRIDYYENYSSVDAMVLIDIKTDLPPHETPVISIGGNTVGADVTIRVDYKTALKNALLSLKNTGVARIGFIGETHTAAKLCAFKNAAAEIFGGAEEKYIYVGEERFEKGGYKAAETLFSSGTLPEALICAYDDMALGAMRFLSDKGISVPEQIKIIGMDNIPYSEYSVPSLSTVNFMSDAVAETAVKSIFEILDGKTPKNEYIFSANLIMRDSALPSPKTH